jgi:hypothetical protein
MAQRRWFSLLRTLRTWPQSVFLIQRGYVVCELGTAIICLHRTAAGYPQRCHRVSDSARWTHGSNTGLPSISKGLIKKPTCSPQVFVSFAFWPLGAAACVSTAKWLPDSKRRTFAACRVSVGVSCSGLVVTVRQGFWSESRGDQPREQQVSGSYKRL